MKLFSVYRKSLKESTDHPMIEHNGKMVHKTNSEGKPIHHTDEGIKNFHNWFEDSKMTDKHGRPQTFYHGTSEDFSHFSKETSNKNTKTGVPENTHFFSNDPDAASSYAKQKSDSWYNKSWGEGGNVKPVYIKAKKVLKIDAKGDPWNNISHKTKEGRGDYDINDLSHIAKGGKYHAMLVKNVHDRQDKGRDDKPATTVAVFTHNQVKSIYNNGKWDKESDNISESTEHPMIEHNGVMVHRNNSEGKPIHHNNEGIKNFHDWFGDSGAKEERTSSKQKQSDMRPLVLYHGTHANINKFNNVNTGTVSHTFGDHTTKRHGIFLTPSKDFAETFAKQGTESGSNMMPLYLHTKNHLDIRDGFTDEDREKLKKHGVDDRTMNSVNKQPHEAWNLFDGKDHFIKAAKKAGYDAIHMTERDTETDKEHHVWVAMHSHQIKSALGNSGDFSTKSNNITESE